MVCSRRLLLRRVSKYYYYPANPASRATAPRRAPILNDPCMKSRRKGDLFPNASVVASYATQRRYTRSALARRLPPPRRGRSLIGFLERNVCLSPIFLRTTTHDHHLLEKRYIPIVPALPNGLKDAFATSNTPIAPAHPRQKGMFLYFLSGIPLMCVRSCRLTEPLPMQRCMELRVQDICARR